MTTVKMSVGMQLEQRWDAALRALRAQAPEMCRDWLRHSRLVAIADGALVVGVPDGDTIELIEEFVLAPHGSTVEWYLPGWKVRLVPCPPQEQGTGEAGDEGQIEADAFVHPELARFAQSLLEEGSWVEYWWPDPYTMAFWGEILSHGAFMAWHSVRLRYHHQPPDRWAPTVRLDLDHLGTICGDHRRTAAGGHGTGLDLQAIAWDAAFARRIRYCAAMDALDLLEAEGVAAVERRESGRGVACRLRVFSLLPLLTPEQAARLKPRSQKDHSRWLLDHGLDAPAWERLTVQHLALPPME
jgi:hypothetical protein